MAGDVEKRAASANLWSALFERAFKILDWAGYSLKPSHVVVGVAAVFSAMLTAWAWLVSRIPAWAIVLVFLSVFALATLLLDRIHALWARERGRRQSASPIDRAALANRLEVLSAGVAALIGEYQGPMQVAWWNEAGTDPRNMHGKRAEVEGKLIERYAYKFQNDVWVAIATAARLVSLAACRTFRWRELMR